MALRNSTVADAVALALDLVDQFSAGRKLRTITAGRAVCDKQLEKANSVILASFFLACYAATDAEWQAKEVPVGIRGQHGDKRLAEELNRRRVTLHGNITAFGENLGWKGNVKNVRFDRDPRFADFCAMLRGAGIAERRLVCEYLASRFSDSRVVPRPLPAVGPDVLTFARAKDLFFRLIALPTEGHLPQFLVAALLTVFRGRYGLTVRTHHPHAADRFDHTAGDIEEYRDDDLVRAYEVTVRPDWKNRLSNFQRKMDDFALSKYIIIAAGVNCDEELAVPARLLAFLDPYERDIAVIDMEDILVVMAGELSTDELRWAVNEAYALMSNPKLSGREEFLRMFRDVVDRWLDS